MRGEQSLDRMFALHQVYGLAMAEYRAGGVDRTLDPNDEEFNNVGEWGVPHYFDVGADALRLIVRALIGQGRDPPRTILDLPCGSGRVTRHLRRFFPEARICASDLYAYHVAFCEEQFGVEGVLSHENPDMVAFDCRFDLIFCGSLLTHLPAELVRSVLRLIRRSLSDTGIAVVTLHGRHSDEIQAQKWKYIADPLYEIAHKTVPGTGFGYVDYDHTTRKVFDRQARYGIALTRPRWSLGELEAALDIRILGYVERDWDDHQDVLIFGKPGVNA